MKFDFERILIILVIIVCNACRKDPPILNSNNDVNTKGNIRVKIIHISNSSPLSLNIFNFISCNHDTISYSNIEYLISEIKLYHHGKELTYPHTFYIHPNASINEFLIKDIPYEKYDSLKLSIGTNHPFNNTDINIVNMAWPDMMGGGYHFLKLEGYFKHNNQNIGFALHIGGNAMQPLKFVFTLPFTVSKNEHLLEMYHLIDEWIQNPTCYKVSSSNYSMGNDSLMNIIYQNGRDVLLFSNFQ
ncbi:MAG: MbnP family protein [Bacteroidota bacterium]